MKVTFDVVSAPPEFCGFLLKENLLKGEVLGKYR